MSNPLIWVGVGVGIGVGWTYLYPRMLRAAPTKRVALGLQSSLEKDDTTEDSADGVDIPMTAILPTVSDLSNDILRRLKMYSPVEIDGVDPNLHYLSPHIPREVWRTLGDHVAAREKEVVPTGCIPGDRWITLRLDGSNFSKVVRQLRRNGVLSETGFSETFATCMVDSLHGLMDKFHAKIGYTQSDEMCIFIPPTNIIRGEQQPHQRNGRVAKMMTLASGYVSARFILALAEQSEGKPEVMAALADITPHFDCRIGQWESWDEAQSLLLWRGYDCSINGVSDAVHQCPTGTKALCRLGNVPKLVWLCSIGQLPLPPHQAYGTTLVRVRRMINGHNPKLNVETRTLRAVIERLSPISILEHAREDTLFLTDDGASLESE